MKIITQFISIILLSSIIISCSGPKPLYTINVVKSDVPATVSFNNETIEADSFLWVFGDGTMSKDSSPTHEYMLSGRYDVTLIASKDGKTGKLEKELILNPPIKCLVLLETSMGEMLIELYDDTPLHRDNFIKLAEENFYDSLLFHRVMEGFMIQGGDPNSKNARKGARLGSGGPGYQIEKEFIDTIYHLKGSLAAARQPDTVNPDRKSSGSQFYIVHGNKISNNQLRNYAMRTGAKYDAEISKAYAEIGGTPQLDRNYTVFGKVLRGIEIIDKIAATETDRVNRPKEDIRILNVKVIK